ncbi:MAG: Putative transposase, partial [uncultured Chloroflexia bacterium]
AALQIRRPCPALLICPWSHSRPFLPTLPSAESTCLQSRSESTIPHL